MSNPFLTPNSRRNPYSAYNIGRFAWNNRHSIGRGVGRTSDWVRGLPSRYTASPPLRRASIASSRRHSSAPTVSRGSSGLTPMSAPSTRVPLKIKRKGNRKVKGTKKVKVSRTFRQKVKECGAAAKLQGYFQANYACKMVGQATSNSTVVDDGLLSPSTVNGSVFSYSNVLHAASRLWNQKAATSTPTSTDVNNFDARTTIIDVRKQWAVMRFKNNSLRTIRMKHILCTPKSAQSTFTPGQAWSQAISDMIGDLRLIGSPTVSKNTMFTGPKTFDQFSQFFSTSETDYTLEPGQSIEETIKGPSMVYDGGKFLANGAYVIHGKQDVYSLVVYYYDLVVATAPVTFVGYANQPGAIQPTQGLLVSSTYHVQMCMPEPTGWISNGTAPAAGAVANGLRLKKYCFDDFNAFGAATTAINREDEQNPF